MSWCETECKKCAIGETECNEIILGTQKIDQKRMKGWGGGGGGGGSRERMIEIEKKGN